MGRRTSRILPMGRRNLPLECRRQSEVEDRLQRLRHRLLSKTPDAAFNAQPLTLTCRLTQGSMRADPNPTQKHSGFVCGESLSPNDW